MDKLKITKKLKSSKGFSLLETLVALIIVLLVASCVTIGISASNRVYKRSLFVSESDLTASTIDIALSDVLRYAYNINCADDTNTVASFSNKNYSIEDGHFVIKQGFLYINTTGEPDDKIGDYLKPLIGGSTYTASKMIDFQLNYNDGEFTGSYTLQSKMYSDLSKTFTFSFRTIS